MLNYIVNFNVSATALNGVPQEFRTEEFQSLFLTPNGSVPTVSAFFYQDSRIYGYISLEFLKVKRVNF